MLAGYRVLDLTDEKGFLCGKLLADLGADVIKVEAPGGDPARLLGPFFKDVFHPEKSLYWFAFNTSKRGMTLDIKTAEGKEVFKRLVSQSDAVVESFAPGYMAGLGLDYSTLSSLNPGLVMTSISPFGQEGPYAAHKGPDIVVAAMSGFMYVCGDPDRAPLRISFPQTYSHAAADAAAATMAALYHRNRSGLGQHVDVSMQESSIWNMMAGEMFWDLNRRNPVRMGTLQQISSTVGRRMNWPCKDGYIAWAVFTQPAHTESNRALVRWMEEEGAAPKFLIDLAWDSLIMETITQEEFEALGEPIGKFFLKHTRRELYEGALKRKIRLLPLNDIDEVLDDAQFKARSFWQAVAHPELGQSLIYPGTYVKCSQASSEIRHRAPLIGEHNQEVYRELAGAKTADSPSTANSALRLRSNRAGQKGSNEARPLEGIKVVSFCWAIVGPLTMSYLADLGAEVVRIETVGRPDGVRRSGPYRQDKPHIDGSACFAQYSRNVHGASLNLQNPKGLEIARKLVAWSDVVAENFSVGIMKRFGLAYDDLVRVNPEVIMISMSPQGQKGPYASHATIGSQLVGVTGIGTLCGWPDRDPDFIYGAYCDFIAPRLSATVLLAALDFRSRTGKGQFLDLSQAESAMEFIAPLILDYTVNQRVATRNGNRSELAAPHGAFRCLGEDRWCAIAASNDEEWANMCRVLGRPAWTSDPRFGSLSLRKSNEDELEKLLEEWTVNHGAEDAMRRMQEARVPAGVVQTAEDLFSDPQLKYRRHFRELVHPNIGKHSYNSHSFRLSRTPPEIRLPSPILGEHTEYVCTKLLGMSDEEFVQAMSQGAFE